MRTVKNILSDYNENKKQTMRGKISNILLFGLISLLYKPFNKVISLFKKNDIYWVRHLYYG